MKIKPYKGRVLWGCDADIDNGVFRWYEWIITSVQNRKIGGKYSFGYEYLSRKAYARVKINGVTWVKRSKKHRDWGWAKNIDRAFKKTFFVDEESGMINLENRSVYTTKRAALYGERKWLKESIADLEETIKDPKEKKWIEESKADLAEETAQLEMVDRRISRKLW